MNLWTVWKIDFLFIGPPFHNSLSDAISDYKIVKCPKSKKSQGAKSSESWVHLSRAQKFLSICLSSYSLTSFRQFRFTSFFVPYHVSNLLSRFWKLISSLPRTDRCLKDNILFIVIAFKGKWKGLTNGLATKLYCHFFCRRAPLIRKIKASR